MWRAVLATLLFLFCGPSTAGFGIFQVNGTPPPASFTPAWQPMLLGDGGNAQGVHVFASGTVTTHVDSYNNFLYVSSGTCTIGGATIAAPCHQPMFATTSITDSTLWAGIQSSLNVGGGEIVECQGNTNVFYAAFSGSVWVSTNRGAAWAKTPQATNTTVNAGPIQSMWLGCDPNDVNANHVWLITQSGGAFSTSNGTSGTSSTWAHNGTIASATGTACNGSPCGGSIAYDPTSSVVSNVTQHFWISADNTGIYETTNGGGAFTLINSAGMPTRSGTLSSDKFGQLWSAPGFTVASSTISVYASGAWSTKTPTLGTAETYILAILFNPTCSTACATAVNNQVIAVQNLGELTVSLNNGGAWTNVTQTATSSAPQALWLGTAKQDVTGILELNVNGGAIDSAGKVWIPGGISDWTTSNPITGCPGACTISGAIVWNANSVGIEQLVVNQILSPPGNGPLTGVWDRATLYNSNPDAFSTVQYPQNANIIEDTFSLDYALSAVSGTANLIVANVTDAPASSSNGGATWTVWPNKPTGQFSAGMIAVGSTTNWCAVPGDSGGADGTIYCTANAAASAWTQATVPGTPSFVPANDRASTIGWSSLVAEKGTAGTFYAVDTAGNVYKSTNSGSSFSVVASAPFDGTTIAKAKLQAVPGQNANLFYTGNPTSTGHLWKSTNSGTTWTKVEGGTSTKVNIPGYGFGAAQPGGSGYPAIYMIAENGVGTGEFVWASFNGGTTFTKINVPTSAQSWALGSLDYPTWINGDTDIYGRIYYGYTGSGVSYIDTADACPWIAFTSIKMNDDVTGTITLTATHSGLVPVSGVQFSVDGSNIGSLQTGAGPTYSVSWVTGGVGTGNHTLKVQASGNGCTIGGTGNAKSIPIVTH